MTSLFQAQRAVDLVKIPDQTGKTFLVTGGNTGIGYEVAKALAAKNAHVFMTARNAERQQGCVASSDTASLPQRMSRANSGHSQQQL